MRKAKNTLLDNCVKRTLTKAKVHRIRVVVFMMALRESDTCAVKRAVVHDNLNNLDAVRYISQTTLCDVFSKKQLRAAWKHAQAMMIEKYTEHNTVSASDGQASCFICMENVPDFLVVHGSSAHGGVCGTCALRTVMEPCPKCSVCMQRVRMVCDRSSISARNLVIYDP